MAASGDTLTGGWGDDTYVVDDAGDVVDESADQGVDTVQASINIDLSLAMFSNIDIVVLSGAVNLDITGNDLETNWTEIQATTPSLAERATIYLRRRGP